MKQRVLTIIIIERRLVRLLTTLLVVFAILYGYFVSASIVNVLVRQEIKEEIAILNSTMSGLEFDYITRKDSINIEYAYALGFTDINKKQFVTRKSLLSQGLSINDEI